jgi:RNA polymerase sigma-70 factor (ECF subfamily)
MGSEAGQLRLVGSEALPPSDAELVLAARGGDDEARQALFARHFVGLTHFVSRLLANSYEVEDVVQDTFMAVMTHLKSLKEPASFRGWLRTIAISQIRRRLRRNRLLYRLGLRELEPVEIEAVVSDETPPELKVELRQIFGLMRSLPADEGVALVLRRVEGLQLTEIAEQMKLSLATVKRKLGAAELHLSQLVGEIS